MEALTGQGTRLSEKAPWESYGSEMETQMSPALAAAVAEYAERQYDSNQSSNQAKEELHRQQEINEEISKEYQWLTPEEYEDLVQRIGRVMTHAEFITKLRKLKVQCWYNPHPHPDKAILVVLRGRRPLEVGCWVQLGYMPELSIMRFDEHGIPVNERRRGWRTCLLQLILKGVVSEQDAIKMFGNPKQTNAFHRYNSLIQAFRNNGSSLAE